MTAVKFKRDDKCESGVYAASGYVPNYVLVDGKPVGVVRKRSEWYGNLGHRGVRYWYFDFFRIDENGKAIREQGNDRGYFECASTRTDCVRRALARIGVAEKKGDA